MLHGNRCERGSAAITAAAIVLLSSGPAQAHGQGLATVAAAFVLAVPLALLVSVLSVLSIALARRSSARSTRRRKYGQIASVVSLIAPVLYSATLSAVAVFDLGYGLARFRSLVTDVLAILLLFGLPALVFGLVSMWLGIRVIRRNPRGS